MFSKRSSVLFSRRALPTVVIPRHRQKTDSSFTSSTNNHVRKSEATSSPHTHHQPNNLHELENQRVLDLAQRVDRILSSEVMNNNDEESDFNGSQMQQQQDELSEAERLLKGNNNDISSFTMSKESDPELAWAERILRERQQEQNEVNHEEMSSSSSSLSQKDAMIQFLKMQQEGKQEGIKNSNHNDGKRGENLLVQLRDGNEPNLSQRETDDLVNYLDSLVERTTTTSHHCHQQEEEETEISSKKDDETSKQNQSAEAEPDYQKQARFAKALSNVTKLLESECGLLREDGDWFLACGTALGFRREGGKFIAHDNDIDIGISYRDEIHDSIVKLVSLTSQVNVATRAARRHKTQTKRSGGDEEEENSRSSLLLCFETLGSKIHYGGFQLRLLDAETGVMIDINLYYKSEIDSKTGEYLLLMPKHDKKDSDESNPKKFYSWFSTFYEEAHRRKYGMYRYAFSWPIKIDQVSCSVDEETYPCPDERYLEEYFGKDWQTPKKYNYEEAIAQKHYRNMIEE